MISAFPLPPDHEQYELSPGGFLVVHCCRDVEGRCPFTSHHVGTPSGDTGVGSVVFLWR